MFVQLIRAPISDASALVRALDEWDSVLRAGATGFLGSTAGVSQSGEAIMLARFADEASARANSDRPEQGEWWSRLEASFTGPVTFFETGEVDVSMGGGSDDAGFVQLLIGRADRAAAAPVMTQADEVLRRERPDIVGGMTLWQPDGRYVDVAYFTSEEEARAGESRTLSDEGQSMFAKLGEVLPVDEYIDIPSPRLR